MVRAVGGLQAQDTPASRLAVRPGAAGSTRRRSAGPATRNGRWSDLGDGGTLHMVAAEDAGWLVGLLGPGSRPAAGAGGCSSGWRTAVRACPRGAAGGAGRRPAVPGRAGPRPGRQGGRIEPEGQAPAHLVGLAAMRGLVCRAPTWTATRPAMCCWSRGRAPAGPWAPRTPWPSWPAATWAATARPGPRTWPPGPGSPSAGPAGLRAGRRRPARGRAGRPAAVGPGRRARRPVKAAGPVVRLLGRFDDYLLAGGTAT